MEQLLRYQVQIITTDTIHESIERAFDVKGNNYISLGEIDKGCTNILEFFLQATYFQGQQSLSDQGRE